MPTLGPHDEDTTKHVEGGGEIVIYDPESDDTGAWIKSDTYRDLPFS